MLLAPCHLTFLKVCTPALSTWPILFSMSTTLLSSLTLSSSLSHHLCANDTQLCTYFASNKLITANHQSSRYHLYNQSIHRKTEFMLIGVSKQLIKIANPSLVLPSTSPITPTAIRILTSSLIAIYALLNKYLRYHVLATIPHPRPLSDTLLTLKYPPSQHILFTQN